MKKILLSALFLMTFLLLVGCNNTTEGKIEITIGFWPASNLTSDVQMYQEWEALFEADYPEYDIIGQPYVYSTDTFAPNAETGQVPIVFETWFTEPEKLVSKNYVRDITDQLIELGWLESMDPDMRSALTFDDLVYGVPRDGYGLGLFLNLELFEMAGIMTDHNSDGIIDIHDPEGNPLYPTTMQELYDTSALISQTMESVYEEQVAGLVILSANNNGGWQFSNLAWNFGEDLQVYDELTNTWKANLNSPAAVKALQWIYDLKWVEEALPVTPSLTYADWYYYIGTNQAAMAFVGSDAINLPVTNFQMNRNNIAFVPMPSGLDDSSTQHQNTLFGGTPYMFSSWATDEQVMGALRFLEYIGRSPETSEIAVQSMYKGQNVAESKGMTIVPTIHPWINQDYLTIIEDIENRYVNVYMPNFEDFFDTLDDSRHYEERFYCQEMYEMLDSVILQVLTDENANVQALLNAANTSFETKYMSRVNN